MNSKFGFLPGRWLDRTILRNAPSPEAYSQGDKADEPALGAEPILGDVVFVHIPKTAGTSMRNMLVAALPTVAKIFHYHDDTARISGTFTNAFTSDIVTAEQLHAHRSKLPRDQQLLVCGHYPLSSLTSAFHPASFVTFLRDPVDRVVSNYRYAVKSGTFSGSFAEFYESADQINVQCRQLRGTDLRNIGFVGLVERMPDMVRALSRHLGVELRPRVDNVTSRFSRPTIDAATRERIRALNDDDLCLYRHVEANLDYFTNYRGRCDVSSRLGRGKVYRTKEDTLIGWALAHDPGHLVQIEVRVGGQPVHRCYADQFLPWLTRQTPHSVGGFQVRLPAGRAAANGPVRVVVAGTEKDLEGSPLVA
ncbi:MAG: sulfotransferase family 2 domain-containing protein [Enhydrobacter sp.]|nr:sulfotransferase family 2 domain-containing protein [Enhydrobacter sp.]